MALTNAEIKARTLELYNSLPQLKAERIKRTDVRDQIIDLNYTFFGYVATKTFINNSSVTYEDKFQSALMHFCECWWWYLWDGDETHKGYRKDISFSVFYKPRIGEMIERELNEVKYSIRRTLCMEVGEQLHKHWGQVKYEDLAHVDLPPDKLATLKAMFGTLYTADIEDHEMYMPGHTHIYTEFEDPSDKFTSITELLVHDMIVYETKLDDAELLKMSDIYGISFDTLKAHLPEAEEQLYQKLKAHVDIYDGLEDY